MDQDSWIVLPDAAAVAAQAAEIVIGAAQAAQAARRRFSIALSGGSTPKALFGLLAQPAYQTRIDWAHTWVAWADERHVPPDDLERNERVARAELLSKVPIPAEQILAVPYAADLSAAEAAASYERKLIEIFGQPLRFDLVLLGMGPDGHTASIFPHQPEATEPGTALVIPVYDAPKPPPTRVSLSYATINAGRAVLFCVTGADKSAAVRAAQQPRTRREDIPAHGVQPTDGTLVWLLDAAAAG